VLEHVDGPGQLRLCLGEALLSVVEFAQAEVTARFVLACADDLGAVKELSETNNCNSAFGSIQVTR